MVAVGFMILCEDHHIEYAIDFTGEKESNEKTEVDEKVYEIPHFTFCLQANSVELGFKIENNSKLRSTFSTKIPSPPPDK